MLCFFTGDCISSFLWFTSFPVNNSFTSWHFNIPPDNGLKYQWIEHWSFDLNTWLSSVATLWRCSPWKPINKLEHLHGECFKCGQTLRLLPKNGPKWLLLNNTRFLTKRKKNSPTPPICLSPSLICTPTPPKEKKEERKKDWQCCKLF